MNSFKIQMENSLQTSVPEASVVKPKSSKKMLLTIIFFVIIIFLTFISIAIIYFINKNKEKDITTTIATTTEEEVIQDLLTFDMAEKEGDLFNDPNGPYYHDISIASSEDGLNFEKEDRILIEKASVPDAVLLPNGRIMLYAVDGGGRSNSGLLVGISDDYGESWDFGSLQMEGLSEDITIAADPEITYLEDGTFRLYFIGFVISPGNSPQYNPVANQILSAISSDGIHFSVEDGVRFSEINATDPDIVNINDTWFMYLSQGPKLMATTSLDAMDFTYLKSIRERGSVSNTVQSDENLWRQFYCNNGIMSATSTDGSIWQDDSGIRLVPEEGEFICDPVPIKTDNGWILIYKIAHLNQ